MLAPALVLTLALAPVLALVLALVPAPMVVLAMVAGLVNVLALGLAARAPTLVHPAHWPVPWWPSDLRAWSGMTQLWGTFTCYAMLSRNVDQ